MKELVTVHKSPYEAMDKAHAIAVLTDWDEFRTYDWSLIYKNMLKPAFVFDGRNNLDRKKMTNIGFQIKTIGKR